MATRSILSRKRDLVYLVYFLVHIPIMFLVDLSSLYPDWMKTSITNSLLAYSKENYKDYMLVPPEGQSAPAWFLLYMWMELIFHVPISFWSVSALLNDNPKLPLVLIIYAFQTVLTTATCMAEYMSWTDITFQEKMDLNTLYGPYLVLSVFMMVDMAARLNGVIDKATASKMVGTAPGKKSL